jgi:hypothetical protein
MITLTTHELSSSNPTNVDGWHRYLVSISLHAAGKMPTFASAKMIDHKLSGSTRHILYLRPV